MKDEFGFDAIPVCWSGSSITSHEQNEPMRMCSYAWHESQIRKCGIRTPGTTGFDSQTGKINRTEPDLIIIYRGTNDMSHTPYSLLTEGYFDDYNWQYPETDAVTGGYGFKEAYCKTIGELRDAYPNAKIFLCTLNVFKRINYSHFPTNNGINSLPQYNNAIREIADFMGCGVIEFDKDGITFENCYSQGYITDSEYIPTHPTNKGHKVMGKKAVADIMAQYSSMT
jgi:lysophospholipase L1-like esterase